jgi:hypothetical protein
MAVEATVECGAGLSRRLLRPFVVEAVRTPAGPALAAALEEVMGGAQELSAREWVEVRRPGRRWSPTRRRGV